MKMQVNTITADGEAHPLGYYSIKEYRKLRRNILNSIDKGFLKTYTELWNAAYKCLKAAWDIDQSFYFHAYESKSDEKILRLLMVRFLRLSAELYEKAGHKRDTK